jgi:hypothetical protein
MDHGLTALRKNDSGWSVDVIFDAMAVSSKSGDHEVLDEAGVLLSVIAYQLLPRHDHNSPPTRATLNWSSLTSSSAAERGVGL